MHAGLQLSCARSLHGSHFTCNKCIQGILHYNVCIKSYSIRSIVEMALTCVCIHRLSDNLIKARTLVRDSIHSPERVQFRTKYRTETSETYHFLRHVFKMFFVITCAIEQNYHRSLQKNREDNKNLKKCTLIRMVLKLFQIMKWPRQFEATSTCSIKRFSLLQAKGMRLAKTQNCNDTLTRLKACCPPFLI